MTAKEASDILLKGRPLTTIAGCLDYGDFYVFSFLPLDVKSGEGYYTGPIMEAIDKKTKKKFFYNITEDVDAYLNAKRVEVKTIFDSVIQ